MPEPQEYERAAKLLKRIGAALYGPAETRTSIELRELYERLQGEDELDVDSALKKMEIHNLLSLELRGSRIGLLGFGKRSFEQNCVAEIILGRDYIARKYRPAIVHIIVQGTSQGGTKEDSGGTGFFLADYSNHIITADHVLRNRTITRIEDNSGQEIPLKNTVIRLAKTEADLAIIECEMPVGIEPIRVEWNKNAVSAGAELLVFGYPKIAGHFPALYQSRAELHAISQRYPSHLDSLIISSTTHPGCSGGPVLDLRGFAIGVVEQENQLELQAGARAYFSATPTHYLNALL